MTHTLFRMGKPAKVNIKGAVKSVAGVVKGGVKSAASGFKSGVGAVSKAVGAAAKPVFSGTLPRPIKSAIYQGAADSIAGNSTDGSQLRRSVNHLATKSIAAYRAASTAQKAFDQGNYRKAAAHAVTAADHAGGALMHGATVANIVKNGPYGKAIQAAVTTAAA